jgi:hypothetical protein
MSWLQSGLAFYAASLLGAVTFKLLNSSICLSFWHRITELLIVSFALPYVSYIHLKTASSLTLQLKLLQNMWFNKSVLQKLTNPQLFEIFFVFLW